MATAEKVFQFEVARSGRRSGRSSTGFSHVMASIFGCWHRQVSRPFTRQGQTFRSCLSCGARKRFDLDTWETSGHFYHA